jgi:hypothetical protein
VLYVIIVLNTCAHHVAATQPDLITASFQISITDNVVLLALTVSVASFAVRVPFILRMF